MATPGGAWTGGRAVVPPAPDGVGRASALRSRLLVAQGLYYVVTGLWAWARPRTFKQAGDLRAETWYARSYAASIFISGVMLVMAGVRRQGAPEPTLFAAAIALLFSVIEIPHWLAGRVAALFMLDGLTQVAFAVGWIAVALRGQRAGSTG